MEKLNDNVVSPSQSPKMDTPEIKPIKYIVVRDSHRVSDNEYDSPTDPLCENEIKFWKNVSKSSCGEKVEVVQYDPEKHKTE